MNAKLSFFGAAQNVTGSRYLLELNGSRFLVDCGLYQERDFKARNWDPFPVPPESIDGVLLTHAHLDHCGLLPKLVREGFQGRIYCTPATSEIAEIVLMDSAHLQEHDAAFKKHRHAREGRRGPHPELPLYTADDARACLPLFSTANYEQTVSVADGVKVSFHDAGHILGSSMIRVRLTQNGETRTVVFSGDVGRWDVPILRDPTVFDEADYVVVESTYGDKVHEDAKDVEDRLAEVINATWQERGNVIIPSFAVERAQELLYHLNNLLAENRIPHLMVFVDSPMALSVTGVFERHEELFDDEMTRLIRERRSPFHFPGLHESKTTDQSKAINHIRGTVIVIAGSGMCTGGRVKHHLAANISRPESTVLFVGYQAIGTLGRAILDGAKKVRILGEMHRVQSRVARINGFSAHADRNELYRWLSGLQKPPRQVFVTHGESRVAKSFADFLAEKTGWETSVPAYRDEVVLD